MVAKQKGFPRGFLLSGFCWPCPGECDRWKQRLGHCRGGDWIVNLTPQMSTKDLPLEKFRRLEKIQVEGFCLRTTLLGTTISHQKSLLKMIFLLPRWDMLVPWRVLVLRPWIDIPQKDFSPKKKHQKGNNKNSRITAIWWRFQPTHPTFHGPNLRSGLHAVVNRYSTLPTASESLGLCEFIPGQITGGGGWQTWPCCLIATVVNPNMMCFWQWLKFNTNPLAVLNNLQHNWSLGRCFVFRVATSRAEIMKEATFEATNSKLFMNKTWLWWGFPDSQSNLLQIYRLKSRKSNLFRIEFRQQKFR